MERNVDLTIYKIYHLENSMIVVFMMKKQYRKVNTIQKMHNKTTQNERLFSAGCSWYNSYLSEQCAVHYAINSSLYLNTLKELYLKLYTTCT